MYLRTACEEVSPGQYQVQWAVGRKRGGIVKVHLPSERLDPELIAELCAMRFLLLDKRVFNVTPSSGRGYCLQVSSGAIRKLALKKSTKSHAFSYASFLMSRMLGAKIQVVAKNEPFMFDGDPVFDEETIHPDPQIYASANEAIETPTMGKLYITAHAVQRYVERNISGDSKNPWLTLVKRVQHPELRQIPIPDKHLIHKRRKYGQDNQVEVWAHPTSTLSYVIINEGENRVLVTVFRRLTATS